MAPPELTGDAPVLDVLQPVLICFSVVIRNKAELAPVIGIERRLSHLFHADKPLRLDHWLNGRMAAVMCADRMGVRNNLYQETKLVEILDHCFSRLVAVHAGVFAALVVHRRVIVENIDLLKVVTQSDFKVVRIMCRRDLHAARSEFLVYIFIRDHRDLAVRERKLKHFSDEIFVALIVRIDSHSGIAEQRLRTGGRDLDKLSGLADDRVIDMPEKSILINVFNLGIRQRCLALRAPVDDPASAVDIALLV